MSRINEINKINISDIKNSSEEIFNRYVNLKRINGQLKALCPFHLEKSPSFNVYSDGGWKCYGCGVGGGDVISFVQQLKQLTFVETLNEIEGNCNIVKSTPSNIIVRSKEEKENEFLIEVNTCKFEKKHKEYWNQYILPESYLNSKHVYAIRKLAYNKKLQDISNEAVFGYWAEEIKKWKILRIGTHVTKENKWKNTIPNTYIHYFPENHVEELWIAKSNKDALVLNYHFGFSTCATQNESAIILLDIIMKELIILQTKRL
jgi:hypothetical protein